MKTAMILAAGRGERLKPITELSPKALCMVSNVPVIKYHLLNLSKAGIEKVIINHSYLGWKIREYINNIKNLELEIIYSPEPPGGLETGGGIFNALPHIGSEPFIVINADIYTDFNLSLLKKPKNMGHVVLFNNLNKNGDFGLNNKNFVTNFQQDLTFTGIACYRPEIFRDLKAGRYSMAPVLRNLANNNQLTGEIHTGSWFDIGTIEQLRLALKSEQNVE